MPLSHLKRPLFLLTVSYAGAIALLGAWGFFRPAELRGWPRRSGPAEIDGVVASACVETRLGDRVILETAPAGRDAARVQAYLPRGACAAWEPRPGQVFRLQGKLRRPRRALMPGDFDEAELLAHREVHFVLHARGAEALQRIVPWRWKPLAWAEAARRSAQRVFRRRLEPDHARLLEGLLFGYKGALEPKLQREVNDAGVMHLIVPSGAKVAFLVFGLTWILTRMGLRKLGALAAACAAGGFYCLMVGSEPPYLRAYAAALAGLAAALWPRREPGGLHAITLSALVMLLAWPQVLFTAGFQMTYAAVLGLWIAVPRWKPSWAPRRWRPALRVLLVSLAVQLALWPIFANIFGRGSVAGLLANILLVPASGWLMAGGFLLWGADGFPRAAPLVETALEAGLGAFRAVCGTFAALPGAAMDLCPMTPAEVCLWYLVCAGLFLLPQWKPALATLSAALLFWSGAGIASAAAAPRLEVCLFGDKKGWAAFASLPGGESVLIDAGLPAGRLADALRELRAKPLDFLVLRSRAPEAARGARIGERWPVRERIGPQLPAGFFRAWRGASLRALPGAAAGAPDLELRWESLRLLLKAEGVALVRRGGPVEFCILQRPSVSAPESCYAAGIRGIGATGALWMVTDGHRYEIEPLTARRSLRHPLL